MGTSRIELTARWRWLPSSELQVGAPPWGLTKADRAENSKTRLKQLALWLFVVVLIVVWFRVNKLWNIFLLFTAHVFLGICKQFWRAPQRNTKHGNTRKFLMPETYPKNEENELITHSAWYLSTMTTAMIIIIIVILSFRVFCGFFV